MRVAWLAGVIETQNRAEYPHVPANEPFFQPVTGMAYILHCSRVFLAAFGNLVH